MTTTDHRSTVLGVYEAFGKGDLPGILGAVGDEVDWGLPADVPVVAAVPWLRHVTTRDDVANVYFAGVVGDLDMHVFDPQAVAADGDHVVSVIAEDYTVRPTGKRVQMTAVHHFTFGPSGRIARYRPLVDTAAMIEGFRR